MFNTCLRDVLIHFAGTEMNLKTKVLILLVARNPNSRVFNLCTRALLHQADDYFVTKREAAKTATSLTELDAMITQLLNYKDTICRRMEVMSASRQQETQKPAPAATAKPGTPAPKPPKIMTVRRYDLCSVKRLQSKEDIDKYVEAIREKLMKTLESCDGVQIN